MILIFQDEWLNLVRTVDFIDNFLKITNYIRYNKMIKFILLTKITNRKKPQITTNHSKELKKATLKTTEKTQKWGRSVPEPEMGEIWARNGSPEP
jgi:hypothetical protein